MLIDRVMVTSLRTLVPEEQNPHSKENHPKRRRHQGPKKLYKGKEWKTRGKTGPLVQTRKRRPKKLKGETPQKCHITGNLR